MTETTMKAVLVGGLDIATDRFEGPIIEWDAADDWSVTRHSDAENEMSPEAKRKREQRERENAAGVGELRVKIGPIEAAMLAEGQQIRGGHADSYTATEYVLTLIRNDNQLLKKQTEKLAGRICKNCQKPMPRGCGGTWGREQRCLLRASEVALSL